MNAHTTITTASHQWASRPADERFLSLPEMLAHKQVVRNKSVGKVISSRALDVQAVGADKGDFRGIEILGANGVPVNPTNWSFGQLAQLVGAPAKYLRDLPSPLVADCINYGLLKRDIEDVGILTLSDQSAGSGELSAVTGPNYGRIWDAEVIASLIHRFGDGVTGDFKVPGEFGKDVPITRANTTLYASDRDMFVFLADEKNKIEVPDRRNGQPGLVSRGFFVWNSEVGKTTFGVKTFTFDYVCMNRIVWGAGNIDEITIRHSAGAPDRFVEELAPAIEAYANSSTKTITTAIAAAKEARLDTDVRDFFAKRTKFTRNQISGMILAHDADEGRPIETVYDAVNGITAYARGIQYQDQRVELEREAGKLLELVAK